MLHEELFCNSTFGSRSGRIGDYRAEVRPAGSDHFYDTNGLAKSDMTIAVTDVVRRMIRADPRLDTGRRFKPVLRAENERRLVTGLASLDDPKVQALVCVNSEQDALELTTDDSEPWIGSGEADAMAIFGSSRSETQ